MITPAREAQIRAVVHAKAAAHSELRRPLTKPALHRVAEREGLRIRVRPHGRLAQLVPLPNGWAIIIDSRTTDGERLMLAAHELAHWWLHCDPDDPPALDVSPPWYDAQREAEADYLAEMLVRGPAPCPPPVARRGRATTRRADPDQLALEVNFSSDLPAVGKSHRVGKRRAESVPADDVRAYERRLARQGAKKMTPRIVADRRTPDDERIVWGNGARPTRYVEPDGHRWTIYNARVAIVDGRAKLELVRDFMDWRATHRIFVDSAGQRRVYRFVPREIRAYKIKHLERQLAAAKQWPRRTDRARAATEAQHG